jgi:BetI-type transcriptional repressor, C-terminal
MLIKGVASKVASATDRPARDRHRAWCAGHPHRDHPGVTASDRPTGYGLSEITVNAWAEALRNPELHEQAHRFYHETPKTLCKLARLWQSEGLVGAEVDATAIAELFVTLMPGMLVTRHLYKPAAAARLAEGMVAFAGAAPEPG